MGCTPALHNGASLSAFARQSPSRQLGPHFQWEDVLLTKGIQPEQRAAWPRNGRHLHLTQKGECIACIPAWKGDFLPEKCGNQQAVQGPWGEEAMPRLPRGGSLWEAGRHPEDKFRQELLGERHKRRQNKKSQE